MITINHLRKEYPNAIPLKDVSVTVNDGDIISVIGPSGTGKSTLIRCINMLDKPTSGEIIVNGECITDKNCNVNEVRKKMGMVFQSFNLFGHLTVIENIMKAPIDILGMSKTDAYKKAMSLLKTVGLEGRAFNYPDMLSGGQKQRVAIARTLSMDPDIILFDEPTSALDPTMVGEVQAVIRDLAKTGKTMMIVTHEMKFAREISNRVFYMDDGGIYEDGSPEQIFDNPEKELTRRFIRKLKVFEAEIDENNFDFIGITSELQKYAYKNLVPSDTLNRICTVFEELCRQIIPEKTKIMFTVEYDDEKGAAQIITLYGGAQFDPHDSYNFISLKILKSVTENIIYSAVSDGEYTNRVVLTVK